MQEDAIFINVARGEIVDEAALYAHLAVRPRFFAGIDAWWVEPVRHGRFTMGYPFLNLPNVIGSPHNSAGGGAWRDEYLRRAVRNCRRALLGETPQNLIGPSSGHFSTHFCWRMRTHIVFVPSAGYRTKIQ